MSRRIIPAKKIIHKDTTISTEKDGHVEIQVPGQPLITLTHAQFTHLQSLMDDVTKWHDDED
jgi:hypothetical protein